MADQLEGPAAERVRQWRAEMDRAGSVTVQARVSFLGDVRRTASAVVHQRGATMRIDEQQFTMSGAVDTVRSLIETAADGFVAVHDDDVPGTSVQWYELPTGERAEQEQFQEVMDVADNLPRRAEPWRVLGVLAVMPDFVAAPRADGGTTWTSVIDGPVPVLFTELGSLGGNVAQTAEVVTDASGLPTSITVTKASRTDASKTSQIRLVLSRWGSSPAVTPPPVGQVVPVPG